MPLYEYKCSKCGKTFEVIQRFADAPLQTHEECGGHVERQISAPSFHFKGTGWYVTDYAKGSTSSPAKHEKSENTTDSKSAPAEVKPDAKPAATTKSDA